MNLLGGPTHSPPSACPYIQGEEFIQEYFFANNLAKDELDIILENGWRKFGLYYFRPKCRLCSKCLPLRVLVDRFVPNKKQRKILKMNSDLVISKEPLKFKEEYYDIYLKHSKRFSQDEKVESKSSFIEGFFPRSCPSFINEYKLDNKIIAWGIIDEATLATSSVYFAFDPSFAKRSLGHYSALVEIDYAKENKYKYYYLGYYIESNSSMAYKGTYTPHETYDWNLKTWIEKC